MICSTLVARTAHAQEDRPAAERTPLGGGGRIVLDVVGAESGLVSAGGVSPLGALGFVGPFTFSSGSTKGWTQGTPYEVHYTILGIMPSADVFVTDRISIGARVGAASMTQNRDHGHALTISPRVGYALPITSSFALWPRLGLGYEFADLGPNLERERTLSAVLDAGAALRISDHVLFDVGPVLSYSRVHGDATDATAFNATGRAALRIDF